MNAERMTSSAIEISAGREPVREILTLPDGYETSIFIHSPPEGTPAKLPMLQLHGIQSHPGWFFGSAMRMAAAGSEVYQLTRRGSGDNVRDKGHARSVKQLMQDISAGIDFICKRSGCGKVHLMGISWGGKLAVGYAIIMRDERLASLTCIAPGLFAKVDVPLQMKLSIAACLLLQPKKLFRFLSTNRSCLRTIPLCRNFYVMTRYGCTRRRGDSFTLAECWTGNCKPVERSACQRS